MKRLGNIQVVIYFFFFFLKPVDMSSGNVTDSNSSSPPPSEMSSVSNSGSTRPMRAAVANAAAISVAQQDNAQVHLVVT
jgi:hypothetical protein